MQRLNSLLSQPELSALNAYNERHQVAQKIWEAIAPSHLAQYSHASEIKKQQLTVYASNNAVAAKIKLVTPSLLINLENRGCEVTSIQVKVQVKSAPRIRPKELKCLSPVAAKQIQTLGEQLAGTPLGDILNRMIKNSR
ncbi:MAG: DUF721 domain-containing protein [Betaproteobacteria bacterium]|nr:DUF721 domain-containing protein [Betaproteobacteria bacterium]